MSEDAFEAWITGEDGPGFDPRYGNHSVPLARKAWMAALDWERSKKVESLGAIGARQAIERINESDKVLGTSKCP